MWMIISKLVRVRWSHGGGEGRGLDKSQRKDTRSSTKTTLTYTAITHTHIHTNTQKSGGQQLRVFDSNRVYKCWRVVEIRGENKNGQG